MEDRGGFPAVSSAGVAQESGGDRVSGSSDGQVFVARWSASSRRRTGVQRPRVPSDASVGCSSHKESDGLF